MTDEQCDKIVAAINAIKGGISGLGWIALWLFIISFSLCNIRHDVHEIKDNHYPKTLKADSVIIDTTEAE